MRQFLVRLANDDSGQDLIEYALVAAILALSGAAVLRSMTININKIFGSLGSSLTNAVS